MVGGVNNDEHIQMLRDNSIKLVRHNSGWMIVLETFLSNDFQLIFYFFFRGMWMLGLFLAWLDGRINRFWIILVWTNDKYLVLEILFSWEEQVKLSLLHLSNCVLCFCFNFIFVNTCFRVDVGHGSAFKECVKLLIVCCGVRLEDDCNMFCCRQPRM